MYNIKLVFIFIEVQEYLSIIKLMFIYIYEDSVMVCFRIIITDVKYSLFQDLELINIRG